ncbi:MAG: primosomal protein N' [Gammaproteobacteria bacterium]|nr:primosomal protein N' [Gammaproteobacteria bacterium]MCW8957774.1 primosomal protein N' [Gammaproteobacteria bacterium]MCW8972185.1 primosomal protein N' [Gammaproteobacteria bacterium]MCW8991835.1 primosomal protein N' [Gammaproteobacteria bacterium]
MSGPILRIAIPSPLRRLFDYLPPLRAEAGFIPGQRFLVPFGRSRQVGILVAIADHSEVPADKLRPALKALDREPLFDPTLMALLRWACDYYHHPPGEVFTTALPVALRQQREAGARGIEHWRLSATGRALSREEFRRAPKQLALFHLLEEYPQGVSAARLDAEFESWRPVIKRLREKGWVEVEERPCLPEPAAQPADTAPPLNPTQQQAVTAIGEHLHEFQALLIEGVTGSGKTEVYLQAIDKVLAAGCQVLVLVPEIGLTPQLLERFRHRFSLPIALLHSGLNDSERLCAWSMAREGLAPIVIGTRSAVFTPMPKLGLIIVDEEHDASFKQQEGFRYSGRDVAVVRARRHNIPIVLGSATPSLESLHNALAGRYRHLALPERAGTAVHPAIHLLDVRQQPMEEGLSAPLLKTMQRHLDAGGQVLLFLNRRGYAPTLLCHDCGSVSHCLRCDAHMTYYARSGRMRCHHCGAERPVPPQCPDCGSLDLRPVGQGTERIEQALNKLFPQTGVVRIDRDSTRRKGALDALLAEVHSGEGRILIGTQMLAKGHHFPNVTLVGILDADQGLFSVDFRAGERMAQLIVQVAGRAGRADKPGTVLIQTHVPDHPLLRLLVEQDYAHFARAALEERRAAQMPPFSHLALLRAEAVDKQAPLTFLEEARQLAEQLPHEGIWLLGPVPAPMERRAGRNRAQLLLQADDRRTLHTLLNAWAPQLEGVKSGRKVRWSLDVDPGELF